MTFLDQKSAKFLRAILSGEYGNKLQQWTDDLKKKLLKLKNQLFPNFLTVMQYTIITFCKKNRIKRS